MYKLLNSAEMKQCDRNTIEYYGIPSAVLMERAALAVFAEVSRRIEKNAGRILIVCGSGNNGGDGLAAARLFYLAGYDVEVWMPADKKKMTAETKAQYETACRYEIPVIMGPQPDSAYAVVVDALFGIGLSRMIEGQLAACIDIMNRIDAYKVAVDLASGVSADTGNVWNTAFRADLTVTFGFAKVGQFLYPGASYTGELVLADIGIDEKSLRSVEPRGAYLERDCAMRLLPERTAYSHKGSYGNVLVIAGSTAMAGAAYFAAKAAYDSGVGLVRIFTARINRDILLTKLPEALLTVYDTKEEAAKELPSCMEWADAVLIGPGLSDSHAARFLVEEALQYPKKKIVLDADALNILSQNKNLYRLLSESCVLTPHLGEMGRLTGQSVSDIRKDLTGSAAGFAERHQAVCVLKDARTVIGMPDGRFVVNRTGNHGMATGGSGDILAGCLAGFLAQGTNCEAAAALAVYLHGMAGDFAAEETGAHSMTASDLLEKIPRAVREIFDGGKDK